MFGGGENAVVCFREEVLVPRKCVDTRSERLEDELLGCYFGKAGLLERWSFSVFVMEVTPLRTCSWMSRGKFRKFRRGRRWEAGDVNVLLESDWRTV